MNVHMEFDPGMVRRDGWSDINCKCDVIEEMVLLHVHMQPLLKAFTWPLNYV